jgi:hypothetical protein
MPGAREKALGRPPLGIVFRCAVAHFWLASFRTLSALLIRILNLAEERD